MIRILIITALLFFTFNVLGQSENTKVEYWESFGIDIKISDTFKLYLEKQLRYEDRFSDLRADIMEGGVRVKLIGPLYTRVNYRYTIQREKKKFRFDGNLIYSFKFKKKIKIGLRTKIQKEYLDDGVFIINSLEFRNRVIVSYKINKKFTPYIGGELFLGLGENAGVLDKIRLSTGIEWDIKKRFRMKAFYHLQKDIIKDVNQSSNVFGIKFNYSF